MCTRCVRLSLFVVWVCANRNQPAINKSQLCPNFAAPFSKEAQDHDQASWVMASQRFQKNVSRSLSGKAKDKYLTMLITNFIFFMALFLPEGPRRLLVELQPAGVDKAATQSCGWEGSVEKRRVYSSETRLRCLKGGATLLR